MAQFLGRRERDQRRVGSGETVAQLVEARHGQQRGEHRGRPQAPDPKPSSTPDHRVCFNRITRERRWSEVE
jgi:hypothetical protein